MTLQFSKSWWRTLSTTPALIPKTACKWRRTTLKRNEAPDSGLATVNAHEEKIVYGITFDLPDAGLADNVVPPDNNVPEAMPNVAMPNVVVP